MVLAVRGLSPLRTDVFEEARAIVAARMRELLAPYEGGVYELTAYHLGWRDEAGRPRGAPVGKMLRPVLCLAVASGYGDPARALDAAVAVELVHAFSLVHDDIEDGDVERRHRPALWALRGVPLAINAGDSLFAMAHRVLAGACESLPGDRALTVMRVFTDACLRMIEGQHRDIAFESRDEVSPAEYEAMAAGKTGALIGAALALGGLCGGAPDGDVERLEDAGVEAGLAFQAIDDGLALWGDAATTGKPAGNDVARGKKSLPAVLARERGIAPQVSDETLREETLGFARRHADAARRLIAETAMGESARRELDALVDFVVEREC